MEVQIKKPSGGSIAWPILGAIFTLIAIIPWIPAIWDELLELRGVYVDRGPNVERSAFSNFSSSMTAGYLFLFSLIIALYLNIRSLAKKSPIRWLAITSLVMASLLILVILQLLKDCC